MRAAAGERGVGGSEARRGGQRWRHTPPPVAGRGGAARRGGREQLGSSKEDRVTSVSNMILFSGHPGKMKLKLMIIRENRNFMMV